MAIDITQVGNNVNSDKIRQFAVDTIDDILKLPTQTKRGESAEGYENDFVDTGSTAIVSTGEVFYLFPSGWAEL